MFTLIDRLLFREVFKALLLILGVLIVILLANNLVRLLGKVAAGLMGQDVLLALTGIELLKSLGFLVPPAFFFSILWVLGRMYRDSEMVALEAAGVGILRIYRPFLAAALPLALAVTWLVMYVLPWAKTYSEQVKAEFRASGEVTGLRPGQFNEFSSGEVVVYTEAATPAGGLRGIFVQHRQHGKLGIVTADEALQRTDPETGERYIVLTKGRRYEGNPGSGDFAIGEFQEYALRIPTAEALDEDALPLSARSWRELRSSDDLAERAELQYRLSFPLAVLAFAVVSVPLARSLPRQGVYGRLGLAVLVYFVFMNLQRVAARWMELGTTPEWLGMWWVPSLMVLVAGLVLFTDSPWFARLWRRWLGGGA